MTLAPPLPEVPTGHEFLDLIWSLLVPAADTYIAVLPPDADPRWASEAGMQFLSVSLLEARAAKEEPHCAVSGRGVFGDWRSSSRGRLWRSWVPSPTKLEHGIRRPPRHSC
jgi:hypothetical protein